MARPKKDGKHISLYLDSKTVRELEEYCEAMGQTKTMAIERILHKHYQEWKQGKEQVKTPWDFRDEKAE